MRKLGFKGRNLIAIAVVAVMAMSGFGVYQTQAAGSVDTNAKVTITAKLAEGDDSLFAQRYTGQVEVRLYKIATLDSTGKATITDNFSDAGIDLDTLNSSNVTVEDVQKKIVEPALAALDNLSGTADNTDYKSFNVNVNNGVGSGNIELEKGAGIYLYVPQDVTDSRYTYSFTSYILFAPSSEYISGEGTSDTWKYDVSFYLKSSATPRLGYLGIAKSLKTYNESLGTASFVYTVEAKLDGKTVFSNVYALNFNKAGEDYIEVADEDGNPIIPAGAEVTVTEEYTGASYKMTATSYTMNQPDENGNYVNKTVNTPVIDADEVLVANFTNDYDDELQVGGISVINTFELNSNDEYVYVGNNIGNSQSEDNEGGN